MAVGWYILRSKPNKESFMCGQIQAHNMEYFYPAFLGNAVRPRARKIRPYFPGYLFIHIDLCEVPKSFWLWLPGSRGLVSFGDVPAVAPDTLIDAIRNKMDRINAEVPYLLGIIEAGSQGTSNAEPCTEYDAIFDDRLTGNDRVRGLMKYLRTTQAPIDLTAV